MAALIAAFASLAAGLIHLSAAPGHWREWWPSGVFFVAIGLFQTVWAGAVLRFGRRLLIGFGVLANLASMALWAISRARGLPFGPHPSVPEGVGVAGVITIVLEAMVVVAAICAALPRRQPAIFTTVAFRSVSVAAALVVAGLMVPGVVSGISHGHGDQGHGDHSDHGDHHDSDPAPNGQDGGGEGSRGPNPSPSPRVDRDPGGGSGNEESHSDSGHSH